MDRPRPSPRARAVGGAGAAARALAMLTAVALLGGCGGGSANAVAPTTPTNAAQEFAGAPLPGNVPAPSFELTDVDGGSVTLADSRGQVTVLAFLDSTCRACVLIAQQIRGALDQLPHPPPVLIVSVDPALDTPARVAAFLAQTGLSGRVSYLVGPDRALAATWRDYHVRTPASGEAAFESGAPVLLIDPLGRERVIFQEEQLTPEGLAHDIGTLQRG
ncbi:MAG TPA: SCO family protein [Solirubrobacteraceae bacterium]|nr:SCO family protein [Solirubrobacteraceae bacterium]